LNLLIIVSDTFRRDHLGCYGNAWIKTPNIDELARQSILFENAYCGSFPTVPNRAEVFTGRYVFTYYDWSPLPRNEVVLSEVLGKAGYTTMLIADTPHILKDGYNFQRGFSGWDWIRGQENDRYMTDPIEIRFPCSPEKLRSPHDTVVQYLRNVSRRTCEADYFAPQTMARACDWLERNRAIERFMLYVDTFDPHEPWDPPRWYVDLYDPGYDGEEVIYPAYGHDDYVTREELKHMRALYAAEATMVDRWVGKVLVRLEDLGLADDTAVIFTTDHGFYLGEHNLIGKCIIAGGTLEATPLYSELARIPLLVRIPGSEPGRIQGLVQPTDIMPTILELAGAKDPGTMHGRSLLPLIKGEVESLRDVAVSSWAITQDVSSGRRSTIADGKWALIYGGVAEGQTTQTTSVVDSVRRSEQAYMPGKEPELYDLESDPGQERNVFDAERDIAAQLHKNYVDMLRAAGTHERYLKPRLAL